MDHGGACRFFLRFLAVVCWKKIRYLIYDNFFTVCIQKNYLLHLHQNRVAMRKKQLFCLSIHKFLTSNDVLMNNVSHVYHTIQFYDLFCN